MINESEIKEEDWPPRTVGGMIYNFLSFADDEFNLVLETPKKRIPWLVKNLYIIRLYHKNFAIL